MVELDLESVGGVFERFGVKSRPVLAAGWLHDVVEDTNVTLEDLRVELDGHDTADVEATLAIESGQSGGSRNGTHRWCPLPALRAASCSRRAKVSKAPPAR